MLNIEKYKDIVLENLNNCHLETSLRGIYGEKVVYCPHTNCGECKERFLKWLLSEYKEQILDDVEKKYLSEVIRPFKKEVATISKFHTCDNAQQYIYIETKDNHFATLPVFPKGTMYKGMKEGKHYSLNELGL